jgi:4-hydroxy-4-methyl-2-oxoglutarate aldolase
MAERRADADAIRARFLQVDTATVSDLLHGLGRTAQVLATDLAPLAADPLRVGGWAYTIRGQMTPYEGRGDPDKMRAIEGVGPGEIAVWAGGTEGVCCFGELLALGMKVRGCAGAIVDGGVRDTHWIAKHGFPVHARYRTPVASTNRWRVTGCGIPVFVRGAVSREVAVHPGDFVLADADGVVVIPLDLIDAILPEAEQLTAREVKVRAEIDAGAGLDVVLQRYGSF